MPADEDNVPEEYLARMPLPWPSADSTLNRKLMEIGIGARLTAEFFNKDEILRKDFVIQEGPPSYENAPRCKCDSVGITVRDLTYEVRNHYLRKAADPGVIVSKVERGSKAAVSGVKHYDIITHVNDTPVMNVGEFEKAVKDQKTLRFAVSRKNRNVLVDLKMEGVPAREGEEKIPPQGRQP
jgi:hypothetical protein